MTATPRRALPPVLRGMGLLARGRAEGLNCFRDTPRAYLSSLAPGLGILAGAVIEGFAQGTGTSAIDDIPSTLCVLLAPAVLSYELARFWGREAFWHRYIVAFNWCQWLLPMIAVVLIAGVGFAQAAGVGGEGMIRVVLICLAGYAVWLNWFLARHGLALTPWRAIGLVAGVNLGTVVIVFGPALLGEALG